MSLNGVMPETQRPVQMAPADLLATTDLIHTVAHTYADAYLADHPGDDRWEVFFTALHGLEGGLNTALSRLAAHEGR